MNKNINNILKEKIKTINLKKKELFWKLLKSISHNNNITVNIKNYSRFNMIKIIKHKSTNSKKNKICLYTGKRKSIIKNFDLSRYKIKNLIIANKLTNFKKNNW